MNRETQDQDDVLIDLGAASRQTLGSHIPNPADGPAGYLGGGGISDE